MNALEKEGSKISQPPKDNQAEDLNRILAVNNIMEYYNRNGLPVIYSYIEDKSYILSDGERRIWPVKEDLDQEANTITQRFFEMKYPDLKNPFL